MSTRSRKSLAVLIGVVSLCVGMAPAVQAETRPDDLSVETHERIRESPCRGSLLYLIEEFKTRQVVRDSLDLVAAGLVAPPLAYHQANPWRSVDGRQLLHRMVETFLDWCVFLPAIDGNQDNGLAFIQNFAWFYYRNDAGQDFVQGRNPLDPSKRLETGLRFTNQFSNERGEFMNTQASTKLVPEWIQDPRIEITDYQKQQPGDYQSWNEFFARELIIDHKTQTIPSRPVTMPDRDYVVSAPTDCIMNPLVQVLSEQSIVRRQFVENPLQFDTVLDVKGIPITLGELLKGVDDEVRQSFVGGTGLSCVLMPNTYHHFHAPVSGVIVHAEVVGPQTGIPIGTYGYLDWPNWVPLDGNVGRLGTDFSQFQVFQRGVIVIEVTYTGLAGQDLKGYVASIPVGLDTIGSVVLNRDIRVGRKVKRGYTELGNFFYGGSLNILLFSEGLATGAVQTRMGNQITLLNVGTTPPVKLP